MSAPGFPLPTTCRFREEFVEHCYTRALIPITGDYIPNITLKNPKVSLLHQMSKNKYADVMMFQSAATCQIVECTCYIYCCKKIHHPVRTHKKIVLLGTPNRRKTMISIKEPTIIDQQLCCKYHTEKCLVWNTKRLFTLNNLPEDF